MKRNEYNLFALLSALLILTMAALLFNRPSRAADSFATNPAATTLPAYSCAAVTPSDSTDLAITARAIFVGTGGNLNVELQNDTPGVATVFKNIPSGSMLSIRARRVHATGTTAADIVEVW